MYSCGGYYGAGVSVLQNIKHYLEILRQHGDKRLETREETRTDQEETRD